MKCCSEYQRYQLLRAIHNELFVCQAPQLVVPNIKDINFWEQFTTVSLVLKIPFGCSEYQRYQLLRAIHNTFPAFSGLKFVVPNIKDINFWEQFTTTLHLLFSRFLLFRISKISTFESNSQPLCGFGLVDSCCSNISLFRPSEKKSSTRIESPLKTRKAAIAKRDKKAKEFNFFISFYISHRYKCT